MPRVTCPECEATVRLPEDVPAGKKVRCPKCEAVFRPDHESEGADAPRRSRSDDRPAARKTPAVLIVIPAIAAALLVYGGTVAAVVITEKKKDKVDQPAFVALPEGAGPATAKAKGPGGGPASAPKGNQTVGLEVGNTAPDIVGEDIDGQQFKLSDYRGKVVVLDFWGHW